MMRTDNATALHVLCEIVASFRSVFAPFVFELTHNSDNGAGAAQSAKMVPFLANTQVS